MEKRNDLRGGPDLESENLVWGVPTLLPSCLLTYLNAQNVHNHNSPPGVVARTEGETIYLKPPNE